MGWSGGQAVPMNWRGNWGLEIGILPQIIENIWENDQLWYFLIFFEPIFERTPF
jgi:hypothetical protein